MRLPWIVLLASGLIGPACSTRSSGDDADAMDGSAGGSDPGSGGSRPNGSGGSRPNGTGGTVSTGGGGTSTGGRPGTGGAVSTGGASPVDGGDMDGPADAPETDGPRPTCFVDFDDPELEKRVRLALGLSVDGGASDGGHPPLDCRAMESLDFLDISNAEPLRLPPASLGGIEHAVNLTELRADYTQVEDVSPLAGLSGLVTLSFRGTTLANVEPLEDHPNLEFLEVSADVGQVNAFDDLTQLGDPPKLKALWITRSSVTDFSHLSVLGDSLIDLDVTGLPSMPDLSFISATLPKLQSLIFRGYTLVDIGPLETLSALDYVNLTNNFISDLGPLVDNPAIADGNVVDVQSNCLDVSSASTQASRDIAALEARGVFVIHDPAPRSDCP